MWLHKHKQTVNSISYPYLKSVKLSLQRAHSAIMDVQSTSDIRSQHSDIHVIPDGYALVIGNIGICKGWGT
jgi:hypothetical protein